VRVSAICHPLRLGDCPSFYRPRRRQFTVVSHCFIYVWRYGVQCRGVDGRPGESRFWRDVMVCPVSVQERLRGWCCRGCPFDGRPRADSRVLLTRGRKGHSSGCGNVLSPRVSTAPGMALQWLGWPHRADGDGGSRPTSRHGPARVQNRRPSPFEGSAVLFRGCGVPAVRQWVAQCRGVDPSLTAQRSTVAGMASPGELAE
jgi:hypothetical protein